MFLHEWPIVSLKNEEMLELRTAAVSNWLTATKDAIKDYTISESLTQLRFVQH